MGIPADIVAEHGGRYAHELRVAAKLAREAGAVALRYHGKDITVQRKAGDEPVTVADHECSALIVAGLKRAFPDDIVISEEIKDDPRRVTASRVWYVDPIDGTKAFIRGESGYCVMIGLTLEHEPMVGLLYQPNYDSLVFAVHQGGAWLLRQGECTPLVASGFEQPKDARHLGAQTGRRADWEQIETRLGLPEAHKVFSIGLKLCTIALGATDLYVNPYTHCSTWDTCAPQVILQESGGTLTDMHGLALSYNDPVTTKHSRGLVGSNGSMHDTVIATFSALFPDPGPE
jgi:3'(2'), 5'-bisphosphate nucleotidase